jgi:hypothetical protein
MQQVQGLAADGLSIHVQQGNLPDDAAHLQGERGAGTNQTGPANDADFHVIDRLKCLMAPRPEIEILSKLKQALVLTV